MRRIWKETVGFHDHGRHAWSDITHFSSSSVVERKKKVGKVHDLLCNLAVNRGCLLWVSLALLLAMQIFPHIPSTVPDGGLDHRLFVKSC